MENRLNQDEFEQFLQNEVKQHRMYPSDHIWKNIRTELHGYRAWPALTFISLFIITALTISTLISNHPHQPILIKTVGATAHQHTAVPANAIAVNRNSAEGKNYFDRAAAAQITAATFARNTETLPAEPVLAENTIPETVPAPTSIPASERAGMIITASAPEIPEQNQATVTTAAFTANTDQYRAGIGGTVTEATVPVSMGPNLSAPQQIDPALRNNTEELIKERRYNPTMMPRKNHRFGFQVYVTPSNSYRKLDDEKVKEILQPVNAVTRPNMPPGTTNADINMVVRHKPAIGMELGFALLYNMSDRFKFKTGVQLNVRQYHIETFQSLTSDLTTLSLINYRGVENLSFYSSYNNNTGYRKAQLDNKIYQVSVPVGIQWEILRGKHFGVNTEASVQPTFTVNNQTYLMSTDYKHYADGDQFIRKWNVNTSMGLNLSYRTGSYSWQIGPQIRYQHLPTYSNAYPIKEHLMDYGVRVGLTKQLR
jgi:hypothetical protein